MLVKVLVVSRVLTAGLFAALESKLEICDSMRTQGLPPADSVVRTDKRLENEVAQFRTEMMRTGTAVAVHDIPPAGLLAVMSAGGTFRSCQGSGQTMHCFLSLRSQKIRRLNLAEGLSWGGGNEPPLLSQAW
jgi:hypothetical protein